MAPIPRTRRVRTSVASPVSTVTAEFDFHISAEVEKRMGRWRASVRDEIRRRLAEIAWSVNERNENIGARRLYTVMERLLDEISFAADRRAGEHIEIDAAYVDARLKELAASEDLARYVL